MRAGEFSSRPWRHDAQEALGGLSGARILLIGNTPPPHGGIAVHVQSLHDRLRELDAWVRVISLGANHSAPSIQGVRSAPALLAELSTHALLGFLPHLHVSGHTLKSWLIAAAVAALRRPRGHGAMLTLHSGMVPQFFKSQLRQRAWLGRIARCFSAIFAVNAEVAEALRSLGVPSAKIRVLAAGFIPAAPGQVPAALSQLRQRSAPLIASAIAQGPIYAARELIRSLPAIAARFPCAGLALFGPGPIEPLRSLARDLGVLERVAFLGELERSRALAVMAESDLFLRATRADGDAISVREALCLGKPVVASRVGERPVSVHLFEPGDVTQMCEQLARAWGMARGGGRLGRALDARARAHADLAQVLESYLALLDKAPVPQGEFRRAAQNPLAALPHRTATQRNEARLDRLAAEFPFGKIQEEHLPVSPPSYPLREGLNALVNAPKIEGDGLRKE